MPALYVNLMPKDQDLNYQRSSRPEQPDQRRPNKAARFPHRTEGLRDSASDVSLIRFTTGTTAQTADFSVTLIYRKSFGADLALLARRRMPKECAPAGGTDALSDHPTVRA